MKRNILNGLFIVAIISFLLPISAWAETIETTETSVSAVEKEAEKSNVSSIQTETTESSSSTEKEAEENNVSTPQKETTESNVSAVEKATLENNIITVSTEEEFRTAVADLNASGDEKIIILSNDIDIPNSVLRINNGTLTILGNGHTLSVWRLDVEGSAIVNLGKEDGSDKLTLTSNTVLNSIVYVTSGAVLNMYDGVTMKDSEAYGVPGAVDVAYESTFNMYGGLITNCSSNPSAGGVMIANNSIFNMYGGTISNNTSTGAGGGVAILDGTTFNMYGGTISNNTALAAGGVAVMYGTFNMTGGAIYNNTAQAGDDIASNNSDDLNLSSVGSGLILNSDGKLITDWYYDGARSTGEVDENGDIKYDETRWNASEIKEDQYLYKYTKPAFGVIVYLKAAHGIDEQTDYTVIHEYYTNGVKDGEVKITDGTGNVGSVISSDDIDKLNSYNNNNYEYTSSDPSYIVLSKDGNNIIILKYDRTVQTDPVKPGDESNNKNTNTAEKINSLNYTNPQTGDTTNIVLWFILLFISGTAGITTSIYNFKNYTK